MILLCYGVIFARIYRYLCWPFVHIQAVGAMNFAEVFSSVACGVVVLAVYGSIVMWRFGHPTNWRSNPLSIPPLIEKQDSLAHGPNSPRGGSTSGGNPRSNAGRVRLVNLNCDMLVEVMSYLSVYELFTMARVSRQLHGTVMDGRVWLLLEHQLLQSIYSREANGYVVVDGGREAPCLDVEASSQLHRALALRLHEAKCAAGVNRLLYAIYMYPSLYLDAAKKQCARVGLPVSFVLINGGVYYFPTEFLSSHPGGSSILEDALGTDASAAYHLAYHSKVARELAQSYCVWDVGAWLGRESGERGGFTSLARHFAQGSTNLVPVAGARLRPRGSLLPPKFPAIVTGEVEECAVNDDAIQDLRVSSANSSSLGAWLMMSYNSLYPSERKIKYETYSSTALEQTAPVSSRFCRTMCSLRDSVIASQQL
jgi:hypothetical protein